MEVIDMLTEIKLLLSITDDSQDELLNTLIKYAVMDATAYTGKTDIETQWPSVIVKMVIYNYNRLGTEGLSSESYSSVSYTYNDDYSDEILSLLDLAKGQKGTVYFV